MVPPNSTISHTSGMSVCRSLLSVCNQRHGPAQQHHLAHLRFASLSRAFLPRIIGLFCHMNTGSFRDIETTFFDPASVFLKHSGRNWAKSRLQFLSASFYVPERPCRSLLTLTHTSGMLVSIGLFGRINRSLLPYNADLRYASPLIGLVCHTNRPLLTLVHTSGGMGQPPGMLGVGL
jgi:hypothetical protein